MEKEKLKIKWTCWWCNKEVESEDFPAPMDKCKDCKAFTQDNK